jgi:hypothetical protein
LLLREHPLQVVVLDARVVHLVDLLQGTVQRWRSLHDKEPEAAGAPRTDHVAVRW